MIKLFSCILIILKSTLLFAEYPYIVPENDLNQEPVKQFEVTNMSSTKSQDNLGICYGFSSTALLENYRCRSLKISCYNSKEQLSVLDVTSFYKENNRSLKEGGFAFDVLTNVSKSDRKIAKEECLNYSQLLAKKIVAGKNDPITVLEISKEQRHGWDKLASMWKKFKETNNNQNNSKDCIHCLAVDIKNNMLGLKSTVDQIEDAFKFSKSVEEFIYKSIFPEECREDSNKFEIPPFTVKNFPERGAKYTPDDLGKKLEQVLLNNIPVELSMCTEKINFNVRCPDGHGHSITIVGIRKNCSAKTNVCKKYVRIRNSYGWDWQKKNNNGWIEMDTLMEASYKINTSYGGQFTWLEEPGRVLENKSL